jgi:hypothetical protein
MLYALAVPDHEWGHSCVHQSHFLSRVGDSGLEDHCPGLTCSCDITEVFVAYSTVQISRSFLQGTPVVLDKFVNALGCEIVRNVETFPRSIQADRLIRQGL